MALKPDRTVIDTSTDYFMNATASRGGIVSISTVGSGAVMDQAQQVAAYGTTLSGLKPLGILLNDVVNLDLTRQRQNWSRDEVQLGSKITVLRKGTVVTNMIYPGTTPTAGAWAYASHSGYISHTDHGVDQSTASRKVGRFESTKDEDGYAKVTVNLP